MDRSERVIVTGASKGIGRALAPLLAAEGMNLLAVARSADALATLAAEIRGRTPAVEVDTLATDLSTREGCAAVGKTLADRRLEPAGLVNNPVSGRSAAPRSCRPTTKRA